LLAYSLPFVGLGLLGGATNQADKWMVGLSLSKLDLGYYSAAVVVALTPCHLLGFLTSQLFSPVVFDAAGSGPSRKAANSAKAHLWRGEFVLAFISLLFLSVIYFWSEELLILLTSREFLPAMPLLLPLAISGVIY